MVRRPKVIGLILLFVFITFFLILLSACEPGGKITFQNLRKENVELFVAHVRADGSIGGFADLGTIPSETTKIIYISFLGDDWVNRLEIRDVRGTVISSSDYKMSDLEKIGWKIVIPP